MRKFIEVNILELQNFLKGTENQRIYHFQKCSFLFVSQNCESVLPAMYSGYFA